MNPLHQFRLKSQGRIPNFLKRSFLATRRFNAEKRALPNFLIIGGQKCGSTALFNYLSQHPQIITSTPKEIFYFTHHFSKDENWYRRHFPLKKTLRKEGAITGEGSTTYLTDPRVPAAAYKLLPNISLIAILREPAARAVSHYYHRVDRGRERRSIDTVFSAQTIQRWTDGNPLDVEDREYFARGDYAAGLERWLMFYPRDQLLVLAAAQLWQTQKTTLDHVFKFLGVGECHIKITKSFNQTRNNRKMPKLMKDLQKSFRRQNKNLQKIENVLSWF